jgi:hypothetical protein
MDDLLKLPHTDRRVAAPFGVFLQILLDPLMLIAGLAVMASVIHL